MKTIHPRSLARKIAKAQLDKAGVTGYNKQNGVDLQGNKIPSKFARGWRKIAEQTAVQPLRKHKKGEKK